MQAAGCSENCRSTTITYISDEEMARMERWARDPVTGELRKVAGNISYAQWRAESVERHGESTVSSMEERLRNLSADQLQYKRHKVVLGEENTPETFAKFQEMKYNDIEGWQRMKQEYSDKLPQSDYEQLKLLQGQLSDAQVRKWYVTQDLRIPDMIDRNAPPEEQARQASNLRYRFKEQARDLMADQTARKQLDIDKPNLTFEQLVEAKMERKGMSRQEAIEDILKTSTKTNRDVNERYGIEE